LTKFRQNYILNEVHYNKKSNMTKLQKKLQRLMTSYQKGQIENYINSLTPAEIGNYLHLIETKKRIIISESFGEVMVIEKEIRITENSFNEQKKANGFSNLKLSWLKSDLNEINSKRKFHLNCWEEIESKMKEKQKKNKLEKMEIIQTKV
jgi:hypothetical protein